MRARSQSSPSVKFHEVLQMRISESSFVAFAYDASFSTFITLDEVIFIKICVKYNKKNNIFIGNVFLYSPILGKVTILFHFPNDWYKNIGV